MNKLIENRVWVRGGIVGENADGRTRLEVYGSVPDNPFITTQGLYGITFPLLKGSQSDKLAKETDLLFDALMRK